MWLLMSTQFGLHQEYMEDLKLVADQHSDFLLLDRCPEKNYTIRCRGSEVYEYPHILQVTNCIITTKSVIKIFFQCFLVSHSIHVVNLQIVLTDSIEHS